MQRTRREFLADVGKGMIVAGIGPALAADLGVSRAWAGDGPDALAFGKLEPLVCLMQETAPDKLLPILTERMASGLELNQVVAAAALANVRTFGGEDYVGFHTMMALSPAYHMARELPKERQALPILKVLYRNSNRIQEKGGRKDEVLHAVKPDAGVAGKLDADTLRDAVHKKDMEKAERTFATLAGASAEDALNALLPTVEEATEVHRVVMVARSWDLLDLVGKEQAQTLLRQSVHYCLKNDSDRYMESCGGARKILPKLLDQYKLAGRERGKKTADDAWVDNLSQTIFKSTAEQAAETAAAALAEDFDPDAIGEAICLAANQLILRDNGRPKDQAQPNKPIGSVHGDSIGLHACDSANAWRKIARISNAQNSVVALMLGAYQVGLDRVRRGGDFLKWDPYPRAEALEKVKAADPEALLKDAEAAIRENNQPRVCAVIQRYAEGKNAPRPVFDLLLKYAVSEDGALHAEKFYRTASEEFAAGREAFRWRQLVALARVTASEYGQPAPGYAEACKLLKV
jgi:hypothetical protein